MREEKNKKTLRSKMQAQKYIHKKFPLYSEHMYGPIVRLVQTKRKPVASYGLVMVL